ncbi:hypothetical protein SLS63_012572 [Diaporthe eres]|uniref:Uncharacterized protein n=1 Tax=Diaporthe eres TaxID=83184 RepID=A0ABR1NQW0_DIAER
MIRQFQNAEGDSERNPEWHLTDDIARLRSYFEQVANGCAEARETLRPRPPLSVTNGDRESALGIAQLAVNRFYDTCKDATMDFLVSGKDPCDVDESEGFLPKVDNAFKEAFEEIIQLPRTENATIKDLTEKSYEIWKESRRLLCEYDFH